MILAARLKTQDPRLKTSRSESDKLAILTKILWLQYIRNRDREIEFSSSFQSLYVVEGGVF